MGELGGVGQGKIGFIGTLYFLLFCRESKIALKNNVNFKNALSSNMTIQFKNGSSWPFSEFLG